MATIFEVEAGDIGRLSSVQLTKLLKILLHAEARSFGISERSVEVALNIDVKDGGEDGRIKWEGGPNETGFLPSRFVQFQNKAMKLAPSICANEIVDKNGKVKAMVDQALSEGGVYILFTTQELNQQQKIQSIDAIKKKLHDLRKPYADSAVIDIYGASRIQGWVNKYIPAITAVLHWCGKSFMHGLQTWEEWAKYPEFKKFEYIEDEDRKSSLESMRELLGKKRKCGRIVGLSGLGKTRMALELCKDVQGDGFSNQVVYYDAASEGEQLPSLIKEWVRQNLQAVLIIDNCDFELHRALKRNVGHLDSKLSVLTLDYNLEPDSDTETIRLKPLDDALIKQMLEPVYGKEISDLDRVVSFAQGFPQMAMLIANARLEQVEDIGKLTDEVILKRMLWGNKQPDQETLHVLRSCALFDKFGLDDSAQDESRFIAKFIAGVDYDLFYACVKTYEKRGIIDRRGRFAQIIPKPLAIRLASEWWEQTTPEKQNELILLAMPGQLEQSFCDQVAKLDFLPEVKKLVENLCGPSAPFGQAKVILSVKGSRLFRSFVEVSPVATSAVLHRILSGCTRDQHKSITGDVRRNLVWALEKLCFHKAAFDKSAKCMMWLAVAENEQWSNNATGQFKQLFRAFGSGTEATPSQRLELIDHASRSKDVEIRKMAVSALESAISTNRGGRTIGAEYQGSSKTLEEWRPKTWKGIFDYWIAGLERLTLIVLGNGTESELAKRTIATSIFGLVGKNVRVMSALDTSIKKIVSKQGATWPLALVNIKRAQSFYSKDSLDDTRGMLDEWVGLLAPRSLGGRLEIIVSTPPHEPEKGEDGKYIDTATANAEKLAEELSDDIDQVIPYLEQLISGEQRQGWTFGYNLVLLSKKWKLLYSKTLSAVSSTEQPDLSFLMGILTGISKLDEKEWETYAEKFFDDKRLGRYYPEAVRTGNIQAKHLNNIIKLIESGDAEEISALTFTYGRALDHLDSVHVTDFVDHLSKISPRAAWVSLDVLSMYCHGDEDKWEACEKTFAELLSELPLSPKYWGRQLEMHHWQTAVSKLLNKNNPDFAKKLARQILFSCKELIYCGDSPYYVKPVLRLLFKKHGKHVWPLISEAVKEADSIKALYLSELLGKETSFDNKQTSVLADLPEGILHKWCKSEPEAAPLFVARATDVYIEENNRFKISERAQFLIDEFGDDDKVLDALSANMHSFGWHGSAVPVYHKQASALEPLLKHKLETVQNWTEKNIEYLSKCVKQETQRDEELTWDIMS